MEYIKLKNSSLTVSRLCMGGCPLGGYGWGAIQEKDLINSIHAALDMGVTIYDTADTYGLGKSEELLAKGLGAKRKSVAIATKFGVRVEDGKAIYDNSPKYIKIACENSLKRLNSDYIDLYQIHYRDGKTPLADVIGALEDLRASGKVRYFGLSNVHKDDFTDIKDHIGSFVSFQDEYSLACRKNEADFQTLSEKFQLTPFTWGSLGQGILTGKYSKDCTFGTDDRRSRNIYVNFHGEKLLKNLEIVEKLRKIASESKKSIAAVAIRFILDFLPESIVIAGVKTPQQLLSNIEAMHWKLSASQIERLNMISK